MKAGDIRIIRITNIRDTNLRATNLRATNLPKPTYILYQLSTLDDKGFEELAKPDTYAQVY